MPEPVRLAKRLAELVPCSRRAAEHYIEGGWVRVNGQVVETPQFGVTDQKIELDAQARLDPIAPANLLWHKPAGYHTALEGGSTVQLLLPGNRAANDRSALRPLKRHFTRQMCVTPLETGASGLVVFSQDYSVQRKLLEEAALLESEVIVEARGVVNASVLQRLNTVPLIDGHTMPPVKVSLSNQNGDSTGLRFAVKGARPGQIARMCEKVGLSVLGMKRIRIGRVPLAGLASGEWRYLMPHERF